MVTLSGTGGAGFSKAGFARVIRPGTVIVRSKAEGMTSLFPSVICHVPFKEMVLRILLLLAHPLRRTNAVNKTSKLTKFLIFDIYICIYE
jgi:hypothetical protein